MNLKDKITEDIKVAMRAKEMRTLEILRGILSSIKNKAIDLKRELEDADIAVVIKSDLKKLEDALETFVEAAREDLVAKTKEEIDVLKAYLPEEMGDEELQKRVKESFSKLGGDVKNIGEAMGVLMSDLKGMVDGKRVREMAEKLLKQDKKEEEE